MPVRWGMGGAVLPTWQARLCVTGICAISVYRLFTCHDGSGESGGQDTHDGDIQRLFDDPKNRS